MEATEERRQARNGVGKERSTVADMEHSVQRCCDVNNVRIKRGEVKLCPRPLPRES